ncbi:MAG: hypothetical protein FWD28_01015 [Treponema sp.]|nr:hypothetical protein [Treponema sp.]
MKKLSVLLVVLILTTGFVFAQENGSGREREIEFVNVEFSFGFPVHWTNGIHDDALYLAMPNLGEMMSDKTVTVNTAFGIALTLNFTKTFGFMLDADMFFGAKLTGFANPTSDFNSLFGANLTIGPVFYLINTDVLRIPLVIGAHAYFFADDLWIPIDNNGDGTWLNRTDLQIGASISLGVQYHFDNNIYILAALMLL